MKPDEALKIATEYLDWSHAVALRPKPRMAPAAPLGGRMMVREMPAENLSAGGLIVIPETAKQRCFEGLLLACGDAAADKLFDQGCELGDHILYGQYVGIREQWDHEIKPGNKKECEHLWTRFGVSMESRAGFLCDHCGAVRVIEPIIIANVDDIAANVDLQVRIENGVVRRYRAEDANGRTRFVTERTQGEASSFEYDNSKEKTDAAAA